MQQHLIIWHFLIFLNAETKLVYLMLQSNLSPFITIFSSWLYALNFGLNQLCKEIVSIVHTKFVFFVNLLAFSQCFFKEASALTRWLFLSFFEILNENKPAHLPVSTGIWTQIYLQVY